MRLFSAKSKTGEFLSQSVFRAKLCAWKTSIDSSIQAQESGEVMRRKWRGYGNSYSNACDWSRNLTLTFSVSTPAFKMYACIEVSNPFIFTLFRL